MSYSMFTAIDWFEISSFFGLLLLFAPLLGRYMARVYEGEKTWLSRWISPIENKTYQLCGITPTEEMSWTSYLASLLVFNFIGFAVLFLILMGQGWLPFNPQKFGGVPIPLAFNTAASFVTNTNWQAYAGETTLSYFSQMTGLTVQNFLSAATGAGLALALIRGIHRNKEPTVGNFWCDLTRTVLYILLPLSVIVALLLISEGTVQTLKPYIQATPLEMSSQTIPLGPAATQVAIKQLGTNGGGFFNANSAHPFENPTALSNFIENLCILLIPAAFTFTFGIMIDARRQGILLYIVMLIIWISGLIIAYLYEQINQNYFGVLPLLGDIPFLEGTEARFGLPNSLLWATATTASANGSVNAVLTSFSPLSGAVALFNILIGELAFGGVGVGLCSKLILVFLTVFLAGLMVGRTPEYLGKKIERTEIQWVMASILSTALMVLIGAGISCLLPWVNSQVGSKGPHALTEILYAFSSTAFNNGSSFTSFNANTDFLNITLGFVMLIGRLSIIIPSLAIAGSLSAKRLVPKSEATFATDSFIFGILLLSVILFVGALSFFPVLVLGPILEQLLMEQGRTF